MSDDFAVQPERVRAAARAFAGEQDTPQGLSSELLGAGTPDTGDPALNEQIRGVVEQIGEVLSTLTQLITADAEALNDTADGYELTDGDVATLMDQVDAGGLPQVRPPLAATG